MLDFLDPRFQDLNRQMLAEFPCSSLWSLHDSWCGVTKGQTCFCDCTLPKRQERAEQISTSLQEGEGL